MKSAKLNIIRQGTLSTIQDGGRFHAAHSGIPQGGFFDQRSAYIANWLVGNHLNGPLMEIAGAGFKGQFEGTGWLSVTGAIGEWALNKTSIEQYSNTPFQDGDIISLNRINRGYRSYLAIGGSIDSDLWLDSNACYLFGGHSFPATSLLKSGAVVGFTKMKDPSGRTFPEDGISSFNNLKHIRILGGPEFEWFSTEQINRFLDQTYTVTNLSSRMGLRLDGDPLDLSEFQQMISSGILPGTIQINSLGLPMILGIDAQTMGGYPRIGVVANADLPRLAQLAPGSSVQFRLIDLEDARQLSQYQEKRLEHYFRL